MRYLVLLFVVVPLGELYLLLWMSGLVGFWPTVALTVVTGIVGGSLAKREGLRVYRQWNRAMAELRPPETGLVEGALVLLGGALLITPGVVTDVVGFLLLVPWSRRPIATRVRALVGRYLDGRTVGHVSVGGVEVPADPTPPSPFGAVIDTTGENAEDR